MPVSNVLYPAELNSHGTYWKIWNTAWHWLISRVFLLFLVYESYEISRCRNQNLEITTKSEILRWTNHTNPETLSPTNSHHETFSKFLAVLGLSKILAILEGSKQILPRKGSLGAPDTGLFLLGGFINNRKHHLVPFCLLLFCILFLSIQINSFFFLDTQGTELKSVFHLLRLFNTWIREA